jgi:hypothetical protein
MARNIKRALLAAEYLAGTGTMAAIAEKHGVAPASVFRAVNDPVIVEAAQPFLRRFEAKLETLAEKLVDRYVQIAESADFADKSTTALGIVTDKLLLLKGQATAITETRAGLTPEALEYLRGLVAAARERGEMDELIRQNVAAGWPEAAEYLDKVM